MGSKKVEVIYFDEKGSLKTLAVSSFLLKICLFLLVFLFIFSGISLYLGYMFFKRTPALEDRIEELLTENDILKKRIAELLEERKKIIQVAALDIQRKASILLKLRKNYGLKFREYEGIGGIYIPFDFDKTDVVRLLKKISVYDDLLRKIPIGYPVKGRISSGFGFRLDPFTKKTAFHSGVDIVAKRGTPIRVTADGIVTSCGYRSDYGRFIIVRHKNGFSTLYAHLGRIFVTSGQRVRKGDVIGLLGCSGRSTGPHLHYEVRLRGRYLNPEDFLEIE